MLNLKNVWLVSHKKDVIGNRGFLLEYKNIFSGISRIFSGISRIYSGILRIFSGILRIFSGILKIFSGISGY